MVGPPHYVKQRNRKKKKQGFEVFTNEPIELNRVCLIREAPKSAGGAPGPGLGTTATKHSVKSVSSCCKYD